MSPSPLSSNRSRRAVLTTITATASTLIAGCSSRLVTDGPPGEGDTIEVMVENRTDDPATIGVRIEDDEGALLFSRVYDLDPGHLDSSAGIETTPATITAFTPTGTAHTWEYTPESDMECTGVDIGLTLQSDGTIAEWYAC